MPAPAAKKTAARKRAPAKKSAAVGDTPAPLKVVYRATKSLVPYARNAKQHTPAQVAQLKASIKEFGFINPILLDGDTGLIAGHGRLMAANELGMTKVPTIQLGHLSDAQKRAYVLADNRLAETNTSWDMALVAEELEAIQLEGIEIELVGFNDNNLHFDPLKNIGSNAEITDDDLETKHVCPKCRFQF